jgi:hypothetical protein
MPDIVTHAAIIGRTQLVPGILPVHTLSPPGECLVRHGYWPKVVDPKRNLDLDVSDCTLFNITHKDYPESDLQSRRVAEALFEQALQAISEITIWAKAGDLVGGVTSFLRQVGRLDVKFFFIEASADDPLIVWRNPLFSATREVLAVGAGLLSNMIVTNGPAAHPVPPVTRRAMGALDLINLGFYTESFVSLFALADDLTQEVLRAGMTKKGLSISDQKTFLRAIKEDRLRQFLNNLTKLCDWHSLAETKPELSERLEKANKRRNRIMHGSVRLSRKETIELGNTLLDLIDWLRTNPFPYAIPPFPLLNIAEGELFIAPAGRTDDPAADQVQSGDAPTN